MPKKAESVSIPAWITNPLHVARVPSTGRRHEAANGESGEMTKSPTIGDLLDGQRDGEKPERRLPAVELLMTGPDSAKLFSNGRPLLKGQLKEATAAMNKLGFGPGEEFKMIFPGGAQVVVRLRTSQERKAGISAIVRRLPKETET